jgi:hypothetical protein
MRRRSYQRALALSATAVITLFGPTAMAAAAPGGGHGGSQGQHGNGTATSSSHSHGHHGAGSSGGNGHHGAGSSGANGHHGAGNSGANGHHGNGNSGANGNHGAGNNGHGNGNGNGNGGQGSGTGGGPGSDGSPPGNNGNVKITGLGDLDSIPNNVAHPGCTFQVEWYGFDQGADIISTVTFESQAPTSDVAIAVDGPASVFVGADPAGGGQDLDGVQAYTLSFTGVPQPQQGYHVRLTVHTPYSNGNDSKSKVFWVEPCQLTPVSPPADDTNTPPGGVNQPPAGTTHPPVGADTHPQVGAESKPPLAVRPPVTADTTGVPTTIDAGENRSGIAGVLDEVASPLPMTLIGAGLLLALVGVLLRRRSSSHPLG